MIEAPAVASARPPSRPVAATPRSSRLARSCLTRLLVGVLVTVVGPVQPGAAAGRPERPAGAPPPPAGVPSASALWRPDRALARSCWSELVTVDVGDGRRADLARRTVDRLLGTAHGVWLVTELCTVLHAHPGAHSSGRVQIHFVETRPECTAEGMGCFLPAAPSAERYQVFVRYQDAGVDPGALVYGEYPGNPGCRVLLLYREPESWMADTLYHELLHVWFLNAPAGKPRRYPTGHGDVGRCEFEEDFLVLLDAFSRELAALEGRAPERLLPFLKTEGARR